MQAANCYDKTMNFDVYSSSHSGNIIDLVESKRNNQQNITNNNIIVSSPSSVGSQTSVDNGTFDRNSEVYKKKLPIDSAYFLCKEILSIIRDK